MEKKTELEIKDFLGNVGLQYSTIGFDNEKNEYYLQSVFQTFCFIPESGKGFELNLIDSLKDLRDLCEDYIQKIEDENKNKLLCST